MSLEASLSLEFIEHNIFPQGPTNGFLCFHQLISILWPLPPPDIQAPMLRTPTQGEHGESPSRRSSPLLSVDPRGSHNILWRGSIPGRTNRLQGLRYRVHHNISCNIHPRCPPRLIAVLRAPRSENGAKVVGVRVRATGLDL